MDQVQFPMALAQPATESHCFTQTLAQFHSRFHNLAVQILLLLCLKWPFEAFSLSLFSCVHCGHALYKDASDWAQTQACVCELDGTSSLPSAKWDCVSALTSLPCLPAAVVHCLFYPFRPDAASRSCSCSRAVCGSCRVPSPWYSEPFPFRHSPVLLLQLFLNFAQVSSLGFLLFTSHSAGSPPPPHTHTPPTCPTSPAPAEEAVPLISSCVSPFVTLPFLSSCLSCHHHEPLLFCLLCCLIPLKPFFSMMHFAGLKSLCDLYPTLLYSFPFLSVSNWRKFCILFVLYVVREMTVLTLAVTIIS